ncbi:MAG TPA: anti-sigma factor, partial [Candidatus Acidoferrum sp.]|nr:anti-sigma factor [Candidatus Acidoferrum sp.]
PHPEFEALGGVVPSLTELGELRLVEPPASLGARIMAAAAADLAEHPRTAQPAATSTVPPTAPPAAAPTAFPSADERAARDERRVARTRRLDWVLRIAAVAAIVVVGAYGLSLQDQLDRAQRFDRAVAAVVQAAGQPDAKTVVLKPGEGASATGIAAVAADGSVVLAIHDLPATSGSQVYETWVIVGKQAPVAVGGFTVDSTGTAAFTTRPATTPSGATIAVTLEPKEGNTAPTLPIVAAGVATSPPAPSS